jgi:hypothetical protein
VSFFIPLGFVSISEALHKVVWLNASVPDEQPFGLLSDLPVKGGHDQKEDLDLSVEWKLQSITNSTRRGFLPTELLQVLE